MVSEVDGDGNFDIIGVSDFHDVGEAKLLVHRSALLLNYVADPIEHFFTPWVLNDL